MPIFTAIGTAIAGALFGGAALAAKLIGAALAFGAQLAISYLTRPQKRKAEPYSAVRGEMRLGGKVPAETLFGTGKVAGHRLDYFKWGEGNKYNAEVLALANGWCDGLEPEIYFYGEKFLLEPQPIIGNEVEHWAVDGYGTLISIRFYDGRPGQGPDMKLVNDTAALGRTWKQTSVAAGLCYVVVEREWNTQGFAKGRPVFEFVLRGLREYDPRKDSTVAGGAGSHRVDEPATWEHSLNPALHRFNYQLGIVKGLVSGRTIIGESKSMGQLDLGTYFAAMNACDALRSDGKKVYQCSLWVSAKDDHTEILQEFDDAMCGYGLNRRGLSGVIAGAPQIPVATLTADDISIDRPSLIKHRKRAFERYNMISGQFISPEKHWQPESLNTVTVNADVAADGRVRQTANDFLQVTDPDLAQYCLNVRYRQNRLGGSAEVPVSRRFGFKVEEGNWISYLGKQWLVTGWALDRNLRIKLKLAETSADIYDDASIDPGPIVIPPSTPVNPSLLSTVQNFDVEAGFVAGGGGADIPALRFTWNPPSDPTIVAVRFFYQIDGEPTVYKDQSPDPESGEHYTTQNVVGGRAYVARATITTVPDRLKGFTPFRTTASATDHFKVILKQFQKEIRDDLQRRERRLSETGARLFNRLTDAATYNAEDVVERKLIEKSVGRANAKILQESVLRAKEDEALAQTITGVQAQVDDNAAAIATEQTARADADSALAEDITALQATTSYGTATGLMGWSVASGPGGVDARFQLVGRVTTASAQVFGGIWLDLLSSGSSRLLFAASQIFFSDGAANFRPVVIQGGQLLADELKVQRGNIINFTATWAEIQTAVVGNFVAQSANIGTLTVDTIHIKNHAVAASGSASGTGSGGTGTWVDIATLAVSNPLVDIPFIYATMGGTFNVGQLGGSVEMRIIRKGNSGNTLAITGGSSPSGSGFVAGFNGTVADDAPAASDTYAIQAKHYGDVTLSSLSGKLVMTWRKK